MRLAVDGTEKVERHMTTRKNDLITITLSTSAGPLQLGNVELLIFEERMEEFLSSKPFL